MSTRIFLTAEDEITRHENNLVALKLHTGETFTALEPRRLFPVNMLDRYISLLDSEGKEIAMIRSLSDLNADSRKTIIESLDDYYLVPHIIKVISVTEKNGQVRWCVDTDRGYKEFDVRNRNHDVRVYRDGMVRIRDSDDNRYIIEDYKSLDKHSMREMAADL